MEDYTGNDRLLVLLRPLGATKPSCSLRMPLDFENRACSDWHVVFDFARAIYGLFWYICIRFPFDCCTEINHMLKIYMPIYK